MSILETINGHNDLINLDAAAQTQLCKEIREFLVSHIAKTGGHLASNLGVVELTAAIETVFDTNKDRLVFDVGHQSYVHKLLTGRQADFDGLRQYGGMSGFPKPKESQTDSFVAGHASSSVSIALGMARARTLLKQDYKVIALIGDGAATGGMAYEGLNDAADSGEPMIIILNDNNMSIDKNVGGMAKHLSRLRTQERYLGMKAEYRKFLQNIPGGRWIFRFTQALKNGFKRLFLKTTMFENMGLHYLGPVDGHDLPELIRILRVADALNGPVLVHVVTTKGQGYPYAELEPSKFHGVGKFDPASGEVRKSGVDTFSDAFGDEMIYLAESDSRVCAITAAMPGGTGLLRFREKFPERLFDVGIAEEHAVSMAGGLAKQGMIPVVAIYSTFLQRSYDQLIQDIALLSNHVVFAVDRAGLVGDDGETHHGVFDVGFLRQIPGMTVLCPGSCAELRDMLRWSVNECSGPVAVRYPRGGDGSFHNSAWQGSPDVCCHRSGSDLTLITYGTLVDQVMAAAEILTQNGVEATVLRLLSVEPLPINGILENMAKDRPVFVVEEVSGGCGIRDALAAQLRAHGENGTISGIDLGNRFIPHGSIGKLYHHCGLDGQSIANSVLEARQNEN